MLIEPASKVSVPLTVVMRIRSKVPDKTLLKPNVVALGAEAPIVPVADQVFDPIKAIVAIPEAASASADIEYTAMPVEFAEVPRVLDAENATRQPTYEVASTEPAPS